VIFTEVAAAFHTGAGVAAGAVFVFSCPPAQDEKLKIPSRTGKARTERLVIIEKAK
jgi:hypothetical protein